MPVEDANEPKIKKKVVAPVVSKEETEPSMIDDVLRLRRQRKAEEIVDREFPPPEAKKQEGESLATTIVTKAMDNLSKAEERAEQAADASRGEVVAANAELAKAREDLYKVQYESIKDMVGKLNTTLEGIRQGSANPKTAKQVIAEAKELDEILHPGGRPTGEAVPQVDLQTQITITKMNQEHELAMKKLDLELQKMKQEWDIKLMEFKDNRDFKQKEYEDSQRMKTDGMGALQDMAVAITHGFERDKGVQSPVTAAAAAAKSGPLRSEPGREGAADVVATIKSFPCQQCSEPLAVPEEGDTIVCPQCSTEYKITRNA